eukprot:3625613-Pyramimonas_sp.AAC.1
MHQSYWTCPFVVQHPLLDKAPFPKLIKQSCVVSGTPIEAQHPLLGKTPPQVVKKYRILGVRRAPLWCSFLC